MDQQIRFGKPYMPPLPKEKLPFAQQLVVRSNIPVYQRQTFQIYVFKDAWKQIMRHVRENVRIECGGILVGHPFQNFDDPDMTFVVITAAIAQDSGSRSVAHFTVGPEEIEAARDEMQESCPGWVCVGWYHSHPGHGVFLSGQDMQIVRSIYNAEWHLALVVDPKKSDAAFFRGSEGERLPGWIELSTIPQTVKAISWYNQAVAADKNSDPRAIERLKQRLLNIPELSHWHSLEKYQDLELKPHFLQKSTHETDRFVITKDDLPIDSKEHSSSEYEGLQNQEIDQIKEKYTRAVKYYEARSTASALNMFREIQKIFPGYKEVDSYIERIEKEEKVNRNRRN